MKRLTTFASLFATAVLLGFTADAAPLGTTFTYQGRLDQNGQPAPNGLYQMTFALFAQLATGAAVGSNGIVTVPVTNGLFAVDLDFGPTAFAGDARWLELTVRTNNGALPFARLAPRTRLAPTPNAVYASTAGTVTNGAVGSAQLAGSAVTAPKIAGGQVVKSLNNLRDDVMLAAGANVGLAANGNTLTISATGLSGWSLSGNTTVAGQFLGTLGNQPLELKANNTRALRLEPNAISPNVIGGWNGNVADAGVSGATIGGGGAAVQFGLSASNRVSDDFGTIGGGAHNVAGNTNGNLADAYYATVGGGHHNLALGIATTIAGGAENRATNNNSFVGGGYQNNASGYISTIGGGQGNRASDAYGVVGGGFQNTAQINGDTVGGGYLNVARGSSSVVGGGYQNLAGGGASTVAGGSDNQADNNGAAVSGGVNNEASGEYSAIGGGSGNAATGYGAVVGGGTGNSAYGRTATVLGGLNNIAAADSSWAGGSTAHAWHLGSFVWADSESTPPPIPAGVPFDSVANDEFAVRARGGVRFKTAFVTISGAGNERAYIGGDGLGGEVQVGSMNPATTTVALYNQTAQRYMHLAMKSCTIYGGADLAEPFQMSETNIAPGSVVAIDPDQPGRLRMSAGAYDRRVAGIVSGANGVNPGIALQQQGVLDGGQNVALSGRVYVRADAGPGPIQPGDLLTTSELPGQAMRVSDQARAQGAILGKAMTALPSGQGLVLVLVTLQ